MKKLGSERLDVAVVGAGQASLALGYYLAKAGLRFRQFDASPAVGHSWARRWDSLRLFTPVRYDSLPGLRFPGERWSHPSKDEVAEYLAAYALHHDLPVQLESPVVRLAGGPGEFRLGFSSGQPCRPATGMRSGRRSCS